MMVRATGLATVTLGGGGAALVGCWLSPQLASRGASTSTAPARRAIAIGISTPSRLRSRAYRRFRQNCAARSRQRDPSGGPPVRSFPARNGSPYEETGRKSILHPPVASHVAPSAIPRFRRRARHRAEPAAATTGPAPRTRGAARCLFARRHRGGGSAGP